MSLKYFMNNKFDKYFLYILYAFIVFSAIRFLYPVANYSFYAFKEIAFSSDYMPEINIDNLKNNDDFVSAVEKSNLSSYQKKIYLDFAFLSGCFDKKLNLSVEKCKVKTDEKMNNMFKADGASKLFYSIILFSSVLIAFIFVRRVLRKNYKILFTASFILVSLNMIPLVSNFLYSSFVYMKPNMFGYEIFAKVYHSSSLGIDMCKLNYGKISDCELKAVRVSNDFVRKDLYRNGIMNNLYAIIISVVLLLLVFYFKNIDDKKVLLVDDKNSIKNKRKQTNVKNKLK